MQPMTQSWVERLRRIQAERDTWLCVGLDPSPSLMPAGVSLRDFGCAIIDATLDYACAFKPNLIFYLSFGSEGLRALEETIAYIPDDTPVILDAKFGDISYTAEHYAHAVFDVLGADAVTITPYVGMDAVTPLLGRPGKMIFVLVRSSNITGNDFQRWPSERAPLYRFVTAQINTLARDHADQLGMIVSATQPRDLALLRSWAPSIPFLIPGIGVQEGDLGTAVQHGMTRGGTGPLIGVARAIIYASADGDYAAAARTAAAEWVERIRAERADHQEY